MEFSYRINELQFVQAAKLRRKGGFRVSTGKAVAFWIFILVCLMLLWGVIQHSSQTAPMESEPAATSEPTTPAHSPAELFQNVLPVAVIAGVWGFMLFRMRGQLGQLYRKDPAMQGTFTVQVTPDGLQTYNTSGASGQTSWSTYEYWREDSKNHLVVLVMKSQACFVLNLADLSSGEQSELRSILGEALPRK